MQHKSTEKYIDLVKKFQKGNKAIFNKIIITYQNYVYKIALKYLQSAQDAEDLTQEVFIKLYQHLDNFKFKSNLKTYIYRIIINEAYNHYKKENKPYKLTNSLEDASNKIIDEVINFDDKLIEQELIHDLEKAILQLTDKHQKIINLKDFKNMTYKEIGKKLNISANAAKIRHFYALKKLKKNFLKQIHA